MKTYTGTKVTAFAHNGGFCDWQSGMLLPERWVGAYVRESVIMETWFDSVTGERAHRAIRVLRAPCYEQNPPIV